MIISASRRTDIAAYYSKWFFNRIREGFCTVPNPFNIKQISLVDLSPAQVDVIVFWTRNASPMLQHLDFLTDKGYRYYFQYTINNYPLKYEKYNPTLTQSVKVFNAISKNIGKGKIIWRYDPIILSEDLSFNYHKANFDSILNEIGTFTKRIVISVVDMYKKTRNRLDANNVNYNPDQFQHPQMEELLFFIVQKASKNGIEVQSCSESIDLDHLGIKHGKCIDDVLINSEFGSILRFKKDKSQRLACGCTESKDIGMNDTCLMGCEYCYATVSHKKVVSNHKKHDPNFPSLIKHELTYDMTTKIEDFKKIRLSESSQIGFEF